MPNPAVAYTQRPDTGAERELSALANVYRFVLDSANRNRNAAGVTSTNGDDAERDLSDSASNDSTT